MFAQLRENIDNVEARVAEGVEVLKPVSYVPFVFPDWAPQGTWIASWIGDPESEQTLRECEPLHLLP
jgi:hypothetical protein